MELMIFIIIFFICWLCIAFHFVSTLIKHQKSSGGVVNYDCLMRKFVYMTPLSKEEVFVRLGEQNYADSLQCTFAPNLSIVYFSTFWGTIRYHFQMEHLGDRILLRFHKIGFTTCGYFPYKLNPYIITKLNAVPLPYAQYGASKNA